MARELLHIRWWFLVPTQQLETVSIRDMMALFESHSVMFHSSLTVEFIGYTVLSVRLRPPNIEEWKRHGFDIFGVTAGIEEVPPVNDLASALQSHREFERREMVRVRGVSEEDARHICDEYGLWGYELCLSEFKREDGGPNLMLWSLWLAGSLEAVIMPLRGTGVLRENKIVVWVKRRQESVFEGLVFVRRWPPNFVLERPPRS